MAANKPGRKADFNSLNQTRRKMSRVSNPNKKGNETNQTPNGQIRLKELIQKVLLWGILLVKSAAASHKDNSSPENSADAVLKNSSDLNNSIGAQDSASDYMSDEKDMYYGATVINWIASNLLVTVMEQFGLAYFLVYVIVSSLLFSLFVVAVVFAITYMVSLFQISRSV